MPRNPSTAEKYNDKDIVQPHSQKSQQDICRYRCVYQHAQKS